MINKELLLYIQAQIAAGMPQEIIKEILMARGGWRAGDIDEAFRSIQNPVAVTPPAPVVQSTPAPTPMVSVAPNPTPAPVTPPAPQPVMQTPASVQAPQPAPAPLAPKPEPSTVRMPGTTLISQSPELQAATPAPAVSLPKVAPTPAPVIKPIIEITPAPRSIPQPVAPVAPPIIQTPVQASKPMTPPSMTINDIKPPVQSVYQPTRVETAPVAPVAAPTPVMQAPMMSSMSMQQPIQQEERIIVEQPAGKGKKIALGILGLLIILLGAGGAYGYFNYISPSPKVAFQRVVPQITNAKTGHFKISVMADFDKSALNLFGSLDKIGADSQEGVQISKDTAAQATLTLDGIFDRTDANASKADTTVTFSTTAAPVTLSIQTKFANATFYAKVPDLGLLADLAGGNTGAFLPGDWVSFSKADLDSGSLPLAVPQNLTSEKQSQITQLFLTGGIIVPTLELSKEALGGATMHRYQFTVDQKALKQALVQSYTLTTGVAPTDVESQSIDAFLSGFSITDGELWVGVWDRKPYKIVFNVKPAGELAGMVKNVKFDISLDSLGLPVSITAPVSAKPFTALFDDAQKKAQDAGVKAGLTSVTPIAEIYYSQKHTYLGLCTSTNGLSQMLDSFSKRPAPNTPYCKDSARFYAVAMPLASESGVSCIDNAGKIVSLAAVPTGTSCK